MRRQLIPALAILVISCGAGDDAEPYSFEVRFCEDDQPAWVAMQDGDEPWRQVTPSAANTWEFNFNSSRGGIAFVYTGVAAAHTDIALATVAEFAHVYPQAQQLDCSTPKTINGSAAGIGEDEGGLIALGGGVTPDPVADGPFSLWPVRAGAWDLIAVRAAYSDDFDLRANTFIIRPGLDIPDLGTIAPAIDFSSSEAVPAATASFTVTGLEPGPGRILVTSSLALAGQPGVDVGVNWIDASAGPEEFSTAPTALLESGDLHMLSVSNPSGSSSRLTHRSFRNVTDQVLPLGPALASPSVSSGASTPVTRPRVQLPMQPEYDQALLAYYHGAQNGVDVMVSSAWLGYPSTWDVTVPDLSEAAGWDNAWGLPPNDSSFEWLVIGLGGSWSFLEATHDGAIARSAGRQSSATAEASLRSNLSQDRPRRGATWPGHSIMAP